MKNRMLKIWKFINEDVWDIELTSLNDLHRWGVQSLRVVYLVIKGFKEDQCFLHASSLTFNTLMAIVPILALSLSLARVFGGAELAETQLRGMVSELTQRVESGGAVTNELTVTVSMQGQAAERTTTVEDGVWTPSAIAEELNNALDAGFRQVEKINFAALGGMGLILLLWMVVAVLGNVEDSFNTVWGVVKGRPIIRKITDYLFMVIVLPFLITMAASFSIAELAARFLQDPWASYVETLVGSGLFKNFTTVLLTTFTFTVLIKFMPNTQVALKPALLGGVISAILFVVWLLICANIQVGVAKYSKLYGSFAIVPIVLFWVYVSWEIILFGAEVAFAVQNCTTYKMEQGSRRANIQSKIILALSVIVEAGRSMIGQMSCFNVAIYARDHRIPVRFLNDIVDEMVQAGFLAPIADKLGCYVLLKLPSEITVREVVDSIMGAGVKPRALGLIHVDARIEQIVKASSSGIGGSLNQMTIQELILE